jgi:hypothetical protein
MPAFAQATLRDEIVYLGKDGQVRVADPQAEGAQPIRWTSQEDRGFYDFTLGDVNNDKDMEIIAIRNSGGGTIPDSQLIVFDPVVTSGPNSDFFENIPWRKLVTITVGGDANVIAAGDFDLSVEGDEILVGYTPLNGSPAYRIDVYKGANTKHDGSSWIKHASLDFADGKWRDSSVGDVFQGGTKEVVLIDYPKGRMGIFRFDNAFTRACFYERSDAPAKDAVITQWDGGGEGEIIMTRDYPTDGAVTLARLYVFRCTNGNLEDIAADRFNPSPFALAAGDVNKNGDDEVFMLRTEDENRPNPLHVISRNDGNMSNPQDPNDLLGFEVGLDKDNGYQSITMGDTDGDGKDEVIVMRDTNIRIFNSPETSTTDTANIGVDSNKFSLESGDLDRNGFSSGFAFTTDRSSLSISVPSGERQTDPFTLSRQIFQLSIASNPSLVRPYTLIPEGALPPTLSFQEEPDANPGATPARILYSVDATTLQPGVYTGHLAVTSSAADVISTTRFTIPITVTVTPARIEPKPASAFFGVDCNPAPTASTTTLLVDGTPGVSFQVFVPAALSAAKSEDDPAARPPWFIGVSPTSGNTGATLTVTVDPSKISGNLAQSSFFIQGDARTGNATRTVDVVVMCTASSLRLPLVSSAVQQE